MALPPHVRTIWIELQKRYTYPVSSIGVMIDPQDAEMLDLWRQEGIDSYMPSPHANRNRGEAV